MMNPVQLARVDLNLLVLFDVLLQEGHVGRAATRLHLTPSAVSHGLARLRRLLNDPLFLRTPKGMVPTERALALRQPVADILASVGEVLGAATPFDPATSARRFVVGAPDAVLASLVQQLWRQVAAAASRIDLGFVHLMPTRLDRPSDEPWAACLDRLERRELDVALLPMARVSARFAARRLYDEAFVVVARRGHPFARRPTMAAYAAANHLLVSSSAEPRGSVESLLEAQRTTRRVAVTVPSFAMALDLVARSELLATLPRRFVEEQDRSAGVVALDLPLERPSDTIHAVTTQAALGDAGVRWLLDEIGLALAGAWATPGPLPPSVPRTRAAARRRPAA